MSRTVKASYIHKNWAYLKLLSLNSSPLARFVVTRHLHVIHDPNHIMPKATIAREDCVDKPQPFRFLDLPKEIRLMVYEQLEITSIQHKVSSKDGHSLHILTRSINGIRILATNRQINDEASAILRPRLKLLLETPPYVIIKERHLDAFHQTRISIRRQPDILDRIVNLTARWHNKSMIRRIHEYRSGKWTLKHLKGLLSLESVDTKRGYGSIQHIATFVLHCVKYIDSSPYQGEFLYPPMVVAVKMISAYDTAVSTLVPVSLGVRILQGLTLNPWAALFNQRRYIPTVTSTTTAIHLVALRRIFASHRCQSMSTKIVMLYEGTLTNDGVIPAAAIDIVRNGVGRAVRGNPTHPGYVQFGGVDQLNS